MKIAILVITCLFALAPFLSAQDTVDELAKAIQTSFEKKSPEALGKLRYTKDGPEDLTKAMQPMLQLASKPDLEVPKPVVHKVADYTPKMELPGSINGKPLEYLVKPTHWIELPLSSAPDANPQVSLKLVFPAAEVEGKWQIPGMKYK